MNSHFQFSGGGSFYHHMGSNRIFSLFEATFKKLWIWKKSAMNQLNRNKNQRPFHRSWEEKLTVQNCLFPLRVDYKKKLIHIFARKTKTDRWVPLSDEFIKKLRQHQDQSNSEYIISFRGKQVKNMHKAFREACKRAGITYEVRMYDIRHRFASELFSNNVSVGVVSRLVGHSRISTTTDVYLEVLPKELFEVRDKLPSLDLPMAENQ